MMNKAVLSDTQTQNFEATQGQVFNQELYSAVLFQKSDEQMIKDLIKVGFDVTRIGYEVPVVEEVKTNEEVKTQADDFPF